MVQRVCLVSGGTGGHLMPAMVLARAMRASGHEAMLVTEGREVERELLRRELPDVTGVELPPAGRFRLGLPLWLMRATAAARRVLREHEVDCVVSTGGRPSVPVALAAKSLGKPVYLLEQNAVTGRANRWLAPFAARIYHGLPADDATTPRALLTGTPLRPELGQLDRAAARALLGLRDDAPVVLVTGGSQGARSLNEIVPQALLRAGVPLQVLHLAGLGRDDAVRRFYASSDGKLTAHVRPVAHDMDRMFGAADLVICRGGGTTVAELCAVGRAAIIVPYPFHRDRQQLRNAEVLARAGAALIVEEPALSVDAMTELVTALLVDPERLERMGAAARALQHGDAATTILRDMGLAATAATGAARAAAPTPAPARAGGGA
jgi:UDP-N-acetylglucosamine--N-acetylmuramyl-(pentapeptide) pyrophosphoryl-undecaprenol N-acetylglucosamine transferase